MTQPYPPGRSGRGCSAILLVLLLCPQGFAQNAENKLPEFKLSSPVKLEMSQQFNPVDRQGKFLTRKFNLSADIKNFSLRYTSAAPAAVAGKQFQGMPQGYRFAELQWQKPWGSLQAYRSTGSSKRSINPSSARTLSGAAIDLPKAPWGFKLTGSLLHAAPSEQSRDPAEAKGRQDGRGSQAILTLARDFKHGFKLRSEWTRSRQEWEPGTRPAEGGGGSYVKLSGNILKTETTFTYRAQEAGLTNPAAPIPGQGKNLLALEMNRTFKGHKFQYSRQVNTKTTTRSRGLRLTTGISQDSLRWSYAPKTLPQMTATQTWSTQSAPGKVAAEDNLALSLNKGLKRLSLGMSYLRGVRIDQLNALSLWERTGWVGDASIEVQKGRKLNFHYESSELTLLPASEVLSSESLRLNTRLCYWEDKLSFVPTLDYRQNGDNLGKLNSSLFHFILTALMKLPRYLPGAEVIFTVSSRRLSALGRPDQYNSGFVVQWNLKRL